MKIPEEYKWAYEKAELSKDRPTLFTGAAFMRLIERIATLTEQLHKCAVAARSYEDAVAMGEPFGDEVKAVLTLRQNADAGFAELAQAKAETELGETEIGVADVLQLCRVSDVPTMVDSGLPG